MSYKKAKLKWARKRVHVFSIDGLGVYNDSDVEFTQSHPCDRQMFEKIESLDFAHAFWFARSLANKFEFFYNLKKY